MFYDANDDMVYDASDDMFYDASDDMFYDASVHTCRAVWRVLIACYTTRTSVYMYHARTCCEAQLPTYSSIKQTHELMVLHGCVWQGRVRRVRRGGAFSAYEAANYSPLIRYLHFNSINVHHFGEWTCHHMKNQLESVCHARYVFIWFLQCYVWLRMARRYCDAMASSFAHLLCT